jgi:MFS family permease
MGRLRALVIDLSPLRESRDFRLLWTGQAISNLGRQITVVAVPFQLYLITHSTLAVGALGLVQVVPYIAVSLVSGTVADRVDRRVLLLWAQLGMTGASTMLLVAAISGSPQPWFLYVVAALSSAFSAIDLPARAATVPNVVSRAKLSAALSLNFAQFQTALVAGPAVGGVVIGRFGLAPAYAIDVVTFGAAIASVALLTPQPVRGATPEPPLTALANGLAFAWRRRPILGGFIADIGAMVFGMPRALFPALALSTYHGGAGALGLMYAAPGVGAVLGSLGSGFIGRVRHPGRAILFAASLWGVSIAAFGLAGFSLWVGLLLLAIGGGADAISAILRGTVLQTLSPDNLRGRLSAVNSMVVVGGPYLGDFRAGAMASVVGPEISLVSGGLACVAVCAGVALALPEMVGYDASAEAG